VAIPTLLAIAYFGLYATDIYVSESSYIVRSPNKKSSGSGLGAMLGGAGFSGFSRAQEDVYTVSEYVKSRDALQQLNRKLDLTTSWKSPQIDIFRRLDPLGLDHSKEALFEYYLKRVSVTVDPASGITSLSTSVFSPQQALEMNQLLLGQAEHLVNVLNERGRNDLVRFAENEVKDAEQKAKAAALAVSHYRNTESVVDPERQTQLHFDQISRLQQELVKTQAQLTQLNTFAPDSPHPPALNLRADNLENEIDKETQKITGGENSLASKAAAYERLALESAFAEKQLASALASLEEARNEAQRQLLYLETIAKPSLPDEAVYPKRFRGVITTFVLGLVAWGILSMLIAGVKEHQH
jgi:capsular polysaccharide transport system permease protein